ncbi:fibronectin type III domain-containing protein [Oceanicoccus sp. KOV_DT_Chl]|uniref:fibronectin type III domain-containing protein n=1 Tax=Oceanicoccus sp. KOV_DT_Chl TaxID=1904639 RepID=UPI000C7E7F96|nr:fibronectin type III domain-containing protein [Oceanicoccus sp. KOV_DT_Chl]
MPSPTKALILIALSSLVIACGGGGGGGGGGGESNATTSQTQATSSNTVASTSSQQAPEQISVPPPVTNNASSNAPDDSDSDDPLTDTELPEAKSISISWTAPATRENGDALLANEISGFTIYYFREGSAQGEGEVVTIDSGETYEHTTPPLPPGTYYFAISTTDNTGNSSALSDFAEATIN